MEKQAAGEKEKVILKLAEIFMRYGIKSVTMDDLARELGISKKTLYLHFPDKESMIRQVVDHQIHQQQAAINQMLENCSLNAIDQIFQMSLFIFQQLNMVSPSLIYDLKKYYPGIWAHIVEIKRNNIYETIINNLDKGIQEGLYNPGHHARILAHMYVNRLEFYTIGDHDLQDLPLWQIFSSIFTYHVRGISSLKGISYLEELLQKEMGELMEQPRA